MCQLELRATSETVTRAGTRDSELSAEAAERSVERLRTSGLSRLLSQVDHHDSDHRADRGDRATAQAGSGPGVTD